MKKILLIICLLLFPNIIYAYENSYFKIEIPENYKDLVEKDSIYEWSSNNENEIPNIKVTIVKNSSVEKQNVEKFTDSDLEEYKKTIENTINSSVEEYDISITVSELEKTELKKYTTLTYTALWPTKESFGYDMYQKNYVITTENYITTLIYTTTNEEDQNSEEIKKVLDSFTVNDKVIIETGFFANRRNQIIVVGIIAGSLGYLISALKKKKTI